MLQSAKKAQKGHFLGLLTAITRHHMVKIPQMTPFFSSSLRAESAGYIRFYILESLKFTCKGGIIDKPKRPLLGTNWAYTILFRLANIKIHILHKISELLVYDTSGNQNEPYFPKSGV